MEAYHNLLASKSALRPSCTNKDKLLQTKLRDRELKAAHKADLNAQKERKAEINQEVHATLKAERLTHDTKRAARDRRYAQKKEHHAETGQECEHGIWRCKICFPHKTAKDGKRGVVQSVLNAFIGCVSDTVVDNIEISMRRGRRRDVSL